MSNECMSLPPVPPCKWLYKGHCKKGVCPVCTERCPVPDVPGVCRYEERGVAIDLGPDIVPVVRCKDCKFLGFKDFSGICNGPKVCGIVQPDDFCSYAERRKNHG